MRTRVAILGAALLGLAAGYFLASPRVAAQQNAPFRMAAVPSERGGQDIYGPYEPVADWPKDLSTLPNHQAWTFGAGQSVFAESADRVYVLDRGELPNIMRPRAKKLDDLGPSLVFPIGRLPWRDATSASLPGNGGTGQIAEEGIQAWERAGNKMGVDARWEHCILVFNSKGDLVESWTQWDSMMQRPHFVAISPYDAEKHVWIVDDHKHSIHEFTHDGKTKIRTIGTYGVPGDDATHFNRPTFMDWFPDGSFVVADGYNGTRVAKFDKNGNFVKAWGERGAQPGNFNTPHSLVVDNNDVVYVADRGNSRIQTFDTEGNRKAVWNLPTAPWSLCLTNGPNPVMFVGSVGRVYKMDLTGKVLGVFGRQGRMPGTLDSIHQLACPDEKTVFLANLYASRLDKWVSE